MPNDRNDNDRNRGNESRSERESLERREYRGSDGQIHHHTKTYMKQHEGSGSRDRNDRSGGKDKHR